MIYITFATFPEPSCDILFIEPLRARILLRHYFIKFVY